MGKTIGNPIGNIECGSAQSNLFKQISRPFVLGWLNILKLFLSEIQSKRGPEVSDTLKKDENKPALSDSSSDLMTPDSIISKTF